jgi:hypothetical protein
MFQNSGDTSVQWILTTNNCKQYCRSLHQCVLGRLWDCWEWSSWSSSISVPHYVSDDVTHSVLNSGCYSNHLYLWLRIENHMSIMTVSVHNIWMCIVTNTSFYLRSSKGRVHVLFRICTSFHMLSGFTLTTKETDFQVHWASNLSLQDR